MLVAEELPVQRLSSNCAPCNTAHTIALSLVGYIVLAGLTCIIPDLFLLSLLQISKYGSENASLASLSIRLLQRA